MQSTYYQKLEKIRMSIDSSELELERANFNRYRSRETDFINKNSLK